MPKSAPKFLLEPVPHDEASQESVRNDFKQFDARMLAETLEDQLFKQALKINGKPGRVPRVSFGGESGKEGKATGDLLESLNKAGLEVDDGGIETISDRVGIPLRRAARPVAPMALSLSALSAGATPTLIASHDATDSVARAGAAALSQAFRGSLAPVRRMIEESSSADDLRRRMLESYPDWSAGRVAALTEEALIAFAANGCASTAR